MEASGRWQEWRARVTGGRRRGWVVGTMSKGGDSVAGTMHATSGDPISGGTTLRGLVHIERIIKS